MTISASQRRLVAERAGGCCEYCRIGGAREPASFHIDHIVSRKHQGVDDIANLCLACAACNRFKGAIVAAFDPQTRELSKLYHPRTQTWHEHFLIESDASLTGLSPEGRTTVAVLRINDPVRIRQRYREVLLGNYPCQTNP